VRSLVVVMVERATTGQPLSVDRDALSLESIIDGTTLARFGVPSNRVTPFINVQAVQAREGGGDGRTSKVERAVASSEGVSSSDADRVLVSIKDLCEDLASLLSDKELTDSALGDAEASRMEQLLAVSDACKAWQKANRER
jgi:stringent starvation protein B